MSDKVVSVEDAVATLEDGMTVGIGGWGSRRKPMAFVRAILRTPVKDLTVVSWGGPDLGILCAAGRVRRAVYAFATLDSIPLEPHFRRAREAAAVEATEWDEGMFYAGLLAASLRLPFFPTRAGLGSDVLRINPDLRTVASPYTGEELVAVPALEVDVAFVHVHRADPAGNGAVLGVDPYFDDLWCKAARHAFVSTERIVATDHLLDEGTTRNLTIDRTMVTGVVEAPHGAHFTECEPDYGRDESFQRLYAASAKDPDLWAEFAGTYLDVEDEAAYQEAVARGSA
ncbi:MAG: acyl CoA--acetate/3-ketoacid CoA transferase subunit alpha [Acidimicrobiia bacterium]|nr:acyl CoA--acetate/3-ketoacid CoA transferase subunit alpha [Acidimicrobiia bacterium]